MNKDKHLIVKLNGRRVGELAQTQDHKTAFAYDPAWINEGFSISPLSLPLQSGVFVPKSVDPFEGLFGVFADSLPDGWGRLLVDRMLRRAGRDPFKVGSLERLAIVGNMGSGALSYEPEEQLIEEWQDLSLDELSEECRKVFENHESGNLDELFRLGGSSGGARPKVFYALDGDEWIVKFPSSIDHDEIGVEEYMYAKCAKACGIEMSETRLLPSALCTGFFATRRFDRSKEGRAHLVSVAGLLETSHRIPNLDYDILMQLTMILTRNYRELEKLYRQMCFNVFSHNRDDHSKNFSFLYSAGVWKLSPTYDLTFSNSLGGEHATTVNGNGLNPGKDDLLAVAKKAKLELDWADAVADDIHRTVNEMLGEYIERHTGRRV